ncbi:DUF4192 domain-containing protein [Streptomyces sediminimaris]|uniref:DUF4192 domain-containing protein n=1 Tax=Streptomyces sediminimaris TaxID=3383721 RepID=UPI00399A117A
MTNHGESTGSSENGKDAERGGYDFDLDGEGLGRFDDGNPGPSGGERPAAFGDVRPGRLDDAYADRPNPRPEEVDRTAHRPDPRPAQVDCTAYDSHGPADQVTLRTPAELADALPYLLGYRPEDSIVLVALHNQDVRGRFGGRARLGIPAGPDDWGSVARQLAQGLVRGSERRGARPEQMVAYLCQEPEKGETGRDVMERLRPLAQKLRVECGLLDVPVIEALCIADGRFWSYCCVNEACCPPEGMPMGLPGTSVLAAAATYAGLQVRGTLRELRARLQPWETAAALEQESALDAVSMALVPRILDDVGRAGVAEETLDLAERIMRRLTNASPVSSVLMSDLRDDELLAHDEAATLILGLQDRVTRDRAAEWMEGEEAAPALRLWRALARRCVGTYGEHAAAPLTLAGWVAWSTGDDLEAREALAMALGADPGYLFARLLHQACNEGLDPESIRRCLRTEREDRNRGQMAAQGRLGAGERLGDNEGLSREEGFSRAEDLSRDKDLSRAEDLSRDKDLSSNSGGLSEPVSASAVEPGRVTGTDGPTPRSRRGGRQRGAAGGRARPAKAEARGSGTKVPRPRTSAAGGTRPGPARAEHTRPRPSGKNAARRRGSRSEDSHSGPGSPRAGSHGIEDEA